MGKGGGHYGEEIGEDTTIGTRVEGVIQHPLPDARRKYLSPHINSIVVNNPTRKRSRCRQ
jgi:hypothetical protein